MSSQLHNQSLIQKSESAKTEALNSETPEPESLRAEVKNLSFSYGPKRVLNQVSMKIHTNKITAMIGPSGCGKTTLLRCFNRMHDLYSQVTYQGEILIYPEGKNILSKEIDPMEVRMRIGMVFQKPNPFPKSIFENVAFGLRVRGIRKKSYLEDRVEQSLQQAGLWNEVKDRLNTSATSLSGGQQQRVCIARALATQPEMLLLDEPTSALDPISTGNIEELIGELKKDVTIVLVTHNLHQAARCSDYTAFMYIGDLIEFGTSGDLFTTPKDSRTENYITGRFG